MLTSVNWVYTKIGQIAIEKQLYCKIVNLLAPFEAAGLGILRINYCITALSNREDTCMMSKEPLHLFS